MFVNAKNKYIRISPYKLRPIANAIKGYSLERAFALLKNEGIKRVKPIEKTLFSAYSNGKNLYPDVSSMNEFAIKEIRVDNGPIIKYYKPGAMGRASIQRKRLSHLHVILEKKEKKKEVKE